MDKYSISAGLDAVEALQKLWETNIAGFNSKQFIKKYTKVIHQLDDRRTMLMQRTLSPKVDEQTKQQLTSEVEEIQLTFTELKRMAETVYDLTKKYPQKLPKPIENAWAIFGDCLWGALKLPFIFGFRAGYVFALKYGNVWETQSEV